MSKPQRVRVTADWSQWLDVEDLLDFVELDIFTADWRRLRLDDDDLLELQVSIMLSPKGAPVVSGTGGLRKLRFAPSRWNRGKRGALRIGYAYFDDLKIAALIVVYPKNEKETLDESERTEIKHLLAEMHEQLHGRQGH